MESNVNFQDIETVQIDGSWTSFLDAVTIFINKPQVLNRKLCGSKVLYQNFAERPESLSQIESRVRAETSGQNDSVHELNEVERLSSFSCDNFGVIIRDLLPKSSSLGRQKEIIFVDFKQKLTSFYPSFKFLGLQEEDDSQTASCSNVHEVQTTQRLKSEDRLPNSTRLSQSSGAIQGGQSTTDVRQDSPVDLSTKSRDPEECINDQGPSSSTQSLKHNSSSHHSGKDKDNSKLYASPNLAYRLRFVESVDGLNSIKLEIDAESLKQEDCNGTINWMKTTLLRKLCSWSQQKSLNTAVTTLRLVELQHYNDMYSYLKEKYGRKFVQIWPEKTDPQKFVYEDVAIASYLLVLWEQERREKGLTQKQSFVDIGCGNGLLVHLLTQEGHPGLGIDVRRRNIWDLYGSDTQLKEQTIVPSAENTFPDYDWLIGNHSDELTPWIPVIAARVYQKFVTSDVTQNEKQILIFQSHFDCRFFLLPCCHHDFNSKFSHKQANESCYRSYLNYVREIGEVCHYKMEEDMLRIPSTKRVCFIGKERTCTKDDEGKMNKEITDFIEMRCSLQSTSTAKSSTDQKRTLDSKNDQTEHWTVGFVPRENYEISKNCKGVDHTLTNYIVRTVFDTLLKCPDCEVRQLANGRQWRKGGTLPLSEVVKLFERDTMMALKAQCGGLQTLLRNHNSVFNVSGGKVQLRDLTLSEPYSKYSKLRKKDNSEYFKTMPCWFDQHHPDGCPRLAVDCTFAHKEEELKSRPVAK